MYHFFVSPEEILSDSIRIGGADYNHMRNVLRLKPGETVSVSDGNERRLTCEISEYTEEEAILRVIDIEGKSAELPARVLLYQGIPKGDKLEFIVQKATELGVQEIIPVAMKRCVAKIEKKKEDAKIERLQRIAESAAKQSGRDVIPEVRKVLSLKEAVQEAAESCDILLFAYEKAESPEETAAAMESLSEGMRIAVFIGPEGGFDGEEAELLENAGARTITLGKRILRTETAPLYLLSVIGYRLEFGGR